MQKAELDRKFCAILPGLSSESGHIYSYHLSVQKAVGSIGWKYKALVSKNNKIKVLPSSWIPVLANDFWDRRKTFCGRIKSLFINIFPIRQLLKKEEGNSQVIIFIEHFELQNLFSLWISFFLLTPRFQFWILHRFSYRKTHLKTIVIKAFHWFLKKKLRKGRLHILTDSDLLADLYKNCFYFPVDVVPIPHTSQGEKIRKKGAILFWWPVGLADADRGLLSVQQLAKALSNPDEHQLILAEKVKDFFPTLPAIVYIPSPLSSDEYNHWMRISDIILLPYSAASYSHRTSGVFVEAICAGSLPVVSKGTWMAYELAKYDLFELILDQEQFQDPHFLISLTADLNILTKLERMRAEYRRFHSEEGFAKSLKTLLDRDLETINKELIK